MNKNGRVSKDKIAFILPPSAFILQPSLGLFVISVFAATATELTKLKPIWRGLLILGRYVVAALASVTLKYNIIAWHLLILWPLVLGLWSWFESKA
jgi:hypothetical protein